MPSSLRKAFAGCAAVLALAAWGGPLAGCAVDSKTPTCSNNVTADGMQNDVDDPCNAFGVCIIDGERAPASKCCVDDDGEPFTGSKLTSCLYGFGEYDLSSDDGSGGQGGDG
jgi:hypothetical protein